MLSPVHSVRRMTPARVPAGVVKLPPRTRTSPGCVVSVSPYLGVSTHTRRLRCMSPIVKCPPRQPPAPPSPPHRHFNVFSVFQCFSTFLAFFNVFSGTSMSSSFFDVLAFFFSTFHNSFLLYVFLSAVIPPLPLRSFVVSVVYRLAGFVSTVVLLHTPLGPGDQVADRLVVLRKQ